MSKKVTLQDIADRLGITKVSVSKAINNQPGVSSALRTQILRTAKELGYAKIKRASERPAYNLAWVCPKRFFLMDETFYNTIYYYINKTCTESGHTLSCFVINTRDEVGEVLPEKLTTNQYDGIFIAGEMRTGYLKKLNSLSGAKIAIDFYHPELQIDCVVTDNFFTGYEVTNYLIQNGHRDIGFVGDFSLSSSVCDRYFGYLKALSLSGLQVNENWKISNNDFETGQYTMDFALPEVLPTAFVCHCDKAAFTLMQRLENMGVRQPEQVSIVSFDNTDICELVVPKLSSVNIDKKQIAFSSMDQLFQRINNPSLPYQKIYLGGSLVKRNSVVTLPR